MLLMFGPRLVEAVTDLARGRNSWPPVFHRVGARLDRHAGAWVVGLVVYIFAGTFAAGELFGP